MDMAQVCIHKIQGNSGPSGISDLCGTVAGMVTPKGRMSTEGETLQVCPTLQVLDMSTLGDAADVKLAVLANFNTQNAFLFPVHAIFRHDCHLAVKPASMLQRPVQKKKNLEILYLLICSFLLCLSVLVVAQPISEVPEGLMITLYFTTNYTTHTNVYKPLLTMFLSEDGPRRVETCHRLYRYLLYSFFWVISRGLNFMCRCFGTLCLFHLYRGCKQAPL